MKAHELRIGNWVADRGGKQWIIDSWERHDKVSAEAPYLGESEFGEITGHPLTEYVEYLQPIPLTEEWLIKFGFIKHPKFEEVFLIINKIGLYVDSSIRLACDEYEIQIEHVHQLQNLYFALTSEELTIKETV